MKKSFSIIIFIICFLFSAQVYADSNSPSTNRVVGGTFSEKVNLFISNNSDKIEKFRAETTVKLSDLKIKTQKDIVSKESQIKTVSGSLNEKKNLQDAVGQPIAHIKLILLAILVFIFATKIFFYGLLVLLILYILRSIYRKIKNIL